MWATRLEKWGTPVSDWSELRDEPHNHRTLGEGGHPPGPTLHRQRRRHTLAHPNRQQRHGRLALPKSSSQVEPTPAKYLVRVDAMRPRHSRNGRAFHQRLFDNPPLLRDIAPLPRGRAQRLTLIRYHRWNLPGSVHLRPKWTPIWSVHFGRMTPYSPPV